MDLEEKLLYPRFEIVRLCYVENGAIHSLARVLATWGYVIRSIELIERRFDVRCYTGDASRRKGQILLHIPIEYNFVGYK